MHHTLRVLDAPTLLCLVLKCRGVFFFQSWPGFKPPTRLAIRPHSNQGENPVMAPPGSFTVEFPPSTKNGYVKLGNILNWPLLQPNGGTICPNVNVIKV